MGKKQPIDINTYNFSITEKFLIAMGTLLKYDTYICSKHGAFQINNRSRIHKCPYCREDGQLVPVEKIKELQEQFRKELI